jgi:hypothetical protein
MTQDEIIEMARQAGGSAVGGPGWTTWVGTQSTEFLERYAILVAEKEREACAKVCDLVAREMDDTNGTTSYIGKLIRARGQA